jgi:hypothetical protein
MLALPELSAVHDRFLTLSRIARERCGGALSGKLLLRIGFDAPGVAALLAASIAGAASLCVDADAAALREGMRNSFCDFVVGQLDEALRILKNELRRGRPVAVGLIAEPQTCLAAMIERGLLPDLLSLDSRDWPDQARFFCEHGALSLPQGDLPDSATSLLQWTVSEDAPRALPQIARLAAEALDAARADTAERRRWLDRSPRYLGRAFGASQCLRMTPSEAAAFLPRAHSAFPSAAITQDGHTVEPNSP